MRRREEPSRDLLRLAAAQSDVVTKEQAEAFGLTRHTLGRLVAQGGWQRLDRGLFMTHNGPRAWESLAWAGVLLGGDDARLGGRAAAHLGRLVDEPPRPIEVRVPHGSPVRPRPGWTFVQERDGARRRRSTGSPPRTLLPDTVLDLCDGADARQVEDWVTKAIQKRLTTPAHLQRALALRSRHSQRALLIDMLLDVDAGAESPLELRYLRRVERAHGLPNGRRQLPSRDRFAVRDVLYEKWGLLVELDGRRGHEGAGLFRDMRRDNRAVVESLATLRYGFGDVNGFACEVAWQVAGVLTGRGWTDEFRRCGRCPRRWA